MVDRLATALDIPLRQHNALLLAAGFAPKWHQRDLAAPDLAEVTSALDYMLAQQEPYPAVWSTATGTCSRAMRVPFAWLSSLSGP